uniref:CSON002715 protein n=1 Tax=Culicoides sonorensis TaxID=179676 RepID=A0A336L256_CULSO
MSEDQSKETFYALNVALKTLSERCEQMQARIKSLEDENMELRTRYFDPKFSTTDPVSDSIHSLQIEILELREKNSELSRQKHQLTGHIEIVAAENRQLWSRLSKFTKNRDQIITEPLSPTSAAHQNLIRSKTFTQNNPNPKLREKFKQNEDPEDLVIDVAKFAISDSNGESSEEFNKLTEGLLELKNEVLRQSETLKKTHEKLQEQKKLLVCKNCASNGKNAQAVPSNDNYRKDLPEQNEKFVDIVLNTTENIDFVETKRKADAINSNDRICPMCGRIYSKDVVFEEFMEHVETHFLDNDDEIESLNIEEPFGYTSNIIHNF